MSLAIEMFEREVTSHTAAGQSTAKHAYTRLVIDLGNGKVLNVEIDAGDWSRALALGAKAPVHLELTPGTARTA